MGMVGEYARLTPAELGRVGFPVDIVRGEEEIPGADDFGYTPPRYLSPERVRVAATALGPLPADVLVRGVTMADLAAAGDAVVIWLD
jgi:hypothetical protein